MGHPPDIKFGVFADPKHFEQSIKSRELPDERASRLRRGEVDAEYARMNHRLVLRAVIALLALVMIVAVIIVFVPGLSPETKNWATATISAIVSGCIGYISGKAAKNP
jgi:hypothetical protein